MNTVSIAEAKSRLSQLIHSTEKGDTVHLSRYGKPVAVLLSESDYQALLHQKNEPWDVIAQWRNDTDFGHGDAWSDEEISRWREAQSGRDFSWNP